MIYQFIDKTLIGTSRWNSKVRHEIKSNVFKNRNNTDCPGRIN